MKPIGIASFMFVFSVCTSLYGDDPMCYNPYDSEVVCVGEHYHCECRRPVTNTLDLYLESFGPPCEMVEAANPGFTCEEVARYPVNNDDPCAGAIPFVLDKMSHEMECPSMSCLRDGIQLISIEEQGLCCDIAVELFCEHTEGPGISQQ